MCVAVCRSQGVERLDYAAREFFFAFVVDMAGVPVAVRCFAPVLGAVGGHYAGQDMSLGRVAVVHADQGLAPAVLAEHARRGFHRHAGLFAVEMGKQPAEPDRTRFVVIADDVDDVDIAVLLER